MAFRTQKRQGCPKQAMEPTQNDYVGRKTAGQDEGCGKKKSSFIFFHQSDTDIGLNKRITK